MRKSYKEWSASAHSRSATGRHFRNLYEGTSWTGKPGVGWSLLDEHPTGAAVCTSCHAPAVADDDPAQFDLRELHGTAAKGVHCDYCHKIAGVGDGKIGLTHGRFNLRLLRPGEGPSIFRPARRRHRAATTPSRRSTTTANTARRVTKASCSASTFTAPIRSGKRVQRTKKAGSARIATWRRPAG